MKRTRKDDLEAVGLVCACCGFERQPARGWPRAIWEHFDTWGVFPATVRVVCSSCHDATNPAPITVHFVDTLHP